MTHPDVAEIMRLADEAIQTVRTSTAGHNKYVERRNALESSINKLVEERDAQRTSDDMYYIRKLRATEAEAAALRRELKEARWRLVEVYPTGSVPVVVQMHIARIDAALAAKGEQG